APSRLRRGPRGHQVPRARAPAAPATRMKIDVHFTPLGLGAGDLAGRGVVVIDALRATTTIITALANGAKAVIPAATSEEAVRLASNLEKDGVLLAGERRSVRIEGFALGNSPREMVPARGPGTTRRAPPSPSPTSSPAGRRRWRAPKRRTSWATWTWTATWPLPPGPTASASSPSTRTAASHEREGAPGADRHRRPR